MEKRSIICTLATTVALVTSAIDLPDPVVHFTMDAISGGMISDVSGNGHDLTLGASISITNGPVVGSSAIYYDGTTNAWAMFACPAMTSRTVAFWMYREATDGPIDASVNKFPYFLNQASTFRLMTTANTTQMRVTLGIGDIAGNYILNNNESTTATRGRWSHYLFVIEDTGTGVSPASVVNFKYWKDGVLQTSKDGFTISTTISELQTTVLGNTSARGSRPLFGAVADFRIYGSAFSDDDARTLYVQSRNEMAGGAELIARWPMETFVTNATDGAVYTPDISGINAETRTDAVGIDNGWMMLGAETFLTNGPCAMDRAVYFAGMTRSWARVRVPCGARDISWSMWINPSIFSEIFRVSGQTKNFPYLVTSGTSTLRFYLQSAKDDLRLQCRILGSTTVYPVMGPAFAARETWSHLVFVDRFSTVDGVLVHRPEIYLNGEFSAAGTNEVATSTAWLTADSNITIGNESFQNNGVRPYEGAMKDVRIYGKCLTADEIRALYRGPAAADAGEDFTTAATTATLRGSVAAKSGKPYRVGYDGDVAWSLVSAPEGGEGATFLRAANPVCEVTLPVAGEYRFLLSVSGFDGTVSTSGVTVVRTAASASNVAPTVSAAAESTAVTLLEGAKLSATAEDSDNAPGTLRLLWSKASGPGGVWFSSETGGATLVKFSATGTYVLRCTAEDGQASAYSDVSVTVSTDETSIDDGLLYHWACNAPDVKKEDVTGSATPTFDLVSGGIGEGVSGYGFKNISPTNAFATSVRLESGTENNLPGGEWATVSMWIYRDSSNENPYFCAPLFGVPYTLYLCYGKYVAPKTWTQQSGLTIYQQGVGANSSYMTYPLPYSFDDRWTHLCFVVNRWKTGLSEMWVDGTKLTSDGSLLVNDNGGRIRSNAIHLGGFPRDIRVGEWNGVLSPASNINTKAIGYRTFPGSMDEIRVYGRKLSEGEIRHLARNPDVGANLAPAIDVGGGGRTFRRTAAAVTADIFDDGIPTNGKVSVKWEVASGDASAVTFGDAASAETTATFSSCGTYTLRLKATDGERVSYGPVVEFDVKVPGTMFKIR